MFIRVFEYFCYVILAIYGAKTIYVFFKEPIIPSLPIVYCIFAVFYIILNIPLVGILAQDSFELMQKTKGIPEPLLNIGFATGLTVSSAFLCNFAKSIYMLHELDHGKYYYYSDWGEILKQRKYVRFGEFALRLGIAVLFIKLELSLHDLNKCTNAGTKIYNCGDVIQTIATAGFGLYGMLFVWLVFAKHLIMEKKVKYWHLRSQLVIIIGGCFNIGYIFFISVKPSAFMIIATLIIALVCSSLVLITILIHSYTLILGFLKK